MSEERILVVLQRYADEGPGAPASAARLSFRDLDSPLGDGDPISGPPLIHFEAGVAKAVGPRTWASIQNLMFKARRRVPRPFFRLAGSEPEVSVEEQLAAAMAAISTLSAKVERLAAAKRARTTLAGVTAASSAADVAQLDRGDFRCGGCGALPPDDTADMVAWLQQHIAACPSFAEVDTGDDLQEVLDDGPEDLQPATGVITLDGVIDSVTDAQRPAALA